MRQLSVLKPILLTNPLGILAAGLLILAFSCTGDQDFSDPNNVSVDSPFISVQSLVTGMESGMRENFQTYLRAVGTFGREVYYFQGADPRFTGELLEGPIDAGGFLVTRPWEARYRVIRTGNSLLETIGRLNLTADEIRNVESWVKTIQAYQFLLNLNYTHENGIITDVAGDTPGPFVGRAEALAFISNLLDEGYGEGQGSGGASLNFSLTEGFAAFDTPVEFAKFNRALKARVEAYRGNYQAVLDALADSFLVLDPDQLELGSYHVYSTGAGDLLNPVFEIQTARIVLHGHPSTQTDAEPGDDRFARKLSIREIVDQFDFLESNLGVVTSTSNSDPFPIIRNEELILLRAEANIFLGNLADAESDINFIREHSGMLGPVSLTQENALDRLLYERRYSLYYEGHRWIDMRRFGRLDDLPIDRTADDKPTGRGNDIVIVQMPRPSNEAQ